MSRIPCFGDICCCAEGTHVSCCVVIYCCALCKGSPAFRIHFFKLYLFYCSVGLVSFAVEEIGHQGSLIWEDCIRVCPCDRRIFVAALCIGYPVMRIYCLIVPVLSSKRFSECCCRREWPSGVTPLGGCNRCVSAT